MLLYHFKVDFSSEKIIVETEREKEGETGGERSYRVHLITETEEENRRDKVRI